ncbi:alkaline shock response membrane anchor protein AmaP [Nonomuraea sp. NPDC001636]|uniref:alkaline shock response membrane anchor protein AmaP n=1 Tax=Nonomuraea sp. NPDC001636 TaxID=3154391 RepID=UPI003331D716
MNRKTGRGNRWGLALVGLVLAVLGGLALARGLLGPSTPIVDAGVRGFFTRNSPPVWWAVAAVSVLVALLALRWLVAQGRRDARTRLRLEAGPDGVTEIAAGGMAHAVAADVEASPAVLNADADLVGPRGHPEVRLRVAADEAAPMSELSEHLSRVTLPNLRDALDRDHVPAVARVSLEPSPATQRVVR